MHQVSAQGSRWRVLGRGTAVTCLLCPKGTVLPRAPCRDGWNKLPGHKGPTRGPAIVFSWLRTNASSCSPPQGSDQPRPFLRDAGCQEEESLLH